MQHFHCNCCGSDFDEPEGVYEKLRCPVCDALKEDGMIECCEDDGEAIKEHHESSVFHKSDDDFLSAANDDIFNTVFDALKALCHKDIEWDMNLIADATERLKNLLEERSLPVCHPWENEEQYICYSLADDRCEHCTKKCKEE